MKKKQILTVTELTAGIKRLLETGFPEVWVEGELSNLSIPQSGHAYFTIKDKQSQIRAVFFRSALRFLKFKPEQGMQVICRGRLSVYDARGEYQVIVEYLEPAGAGALQLAFEQLKTRLEAEGLFDPDRKKKLPLLPRCIGIVTSPTGAAIRDMLRVIHRRHPRVHILIYPAPVQGAEAAEALAEGIRYFNRSGKIDVIIIGRGGGSLEDLFAFNDESLARAVFASAVPVISAVGHETDYTISDFVADLRAPTPSAAAEMVVDSEERFIQLLDSYDSALTRSIRHRLTVASSSLGRCTALLRDPRRVLRDQHRRVSSLAARLQTDIRNHLARAEARVASLASSLDHLNPLAILGRGYSVTTRLRDKMILKSADDVVSGEILSTRLSGGWVLSKAIDASEHPFREGSEPDFTLPAAFPEE